jgi:hypothetical protein
MLLSLPLIMNNLNCKSKTKLLFIFKILLKIKHNLELYNLFNITITNYYFIFLNFKQILLVECTLSRSYYARLFLILHFKLIQISLLLFHNFHNLFYLFNIKMCIIYTLLLFHFFYYKPVHFLYILLCLV